MSLGGRFLVGLCRLSALHDPILSPKRVSQTHTQQRHLCEKI
jgi:hypothetical protein